MRISWLKFNEISQNLGSGIWAAQAILQDSDNLSAIEGSPITLF